MSWWWTPWMFMMLLYRDEYEVRVNTMSVYDVCDVIVQGWVWGEGEHYECLWCYCTGMSMSWGWTSWIFMMCVMLLYRDEYEVRVNTMNVYDVWCYCTGMSMRWGWTPWMFMMCDVIVQGWVWAEGEYHHGSDLRSVSAKVWTWRPAGPDRHVPLHRNDLRQEETSRGIQGSNLWGTLVALFFSRFAHMSF